MGLLRVNVFFFFFGFFLCLFCFSNVLSSDLNLLRNALNDRVMTLMGLEIHGRVSIMLYEGNNFRDFLFAFSHTDHLLKRNPL